MLKPRVNFSNNESVFDIWIIQLTLSSSPRHSALNRGRSICSINLSWFLCPDSIAWDSTVRFLWNSILWFLYMCSLCVKGGSSYTGLGNKFGPRSPFNTRSSCWKNKVSISSFIIIRFPSWKIFTIVYVFLFFRTWLYLFCGMVQKCVYLILSQCLIAFLSSEIPSFFEPFQASS